jgi:nitroreductase
MDTIEAIRSRRSIRSFRPDVVPRSMIQKVIADAAQAPPPFSGQVPWAFSVLEGARRIAELGRKGDAIRKGPSARRAGMELGRQSRPQGLLERASGDRDLRPEIAAAPDRT